MSRMLPLLCVFAACAPPALGVSSLSDAGPAPVAALKLNADTYWRYTQFRRAVEALDVGEADGGALEALRAQAKAYREICRKWRLSGEAFRRIDEMVRAVAQKRDRARRRAAQAERLQTLVDKLPKDQRDPFEQELADARRESEEDKRMLEERGWFGDANVDFILAQEEAP